MAILSIQNARKHFGGVKAVDSASLELEEGEIAGLIGSNGAGKTTLFNLITGFLPPDSGKIFFEESRIDGLGPYQIARRGIARTFQITKALSRMSVMENMLLGPRNQTGESWWRALLTPGKVKKEEENYKDKALTILDFFQLSHMKNEYAGALSGGQKKLLELARALMLDPDLVLLDEPFAGVNPTLKEKLLEYIERLQKGGLTFAIIEHDIPIVDKIADHLLVMDDGKIIAKGTLKDIKKNEKVLRTYLGEEI